MVIFHSYVSLPEGIYIYTYDVNLLVYIILVTKFFFLSYWITIGNDYCLKEESKQISLLAFEAWV